MQNLATYKDKSFPLSYNDKVHPDLLPDGYCELILNGFLDGNTIAERNGYTLIADDTGEDNSADSEESKRWLPITGRLVG